MSVVSFNFSHPFPNKGDFSSLLLPSFQGTLSVDSLLGSCSVPIDFPLFGLNCFMLSEVSGEFCLKIYITIQCLFLSGLYPVPSVLLEAFLACSLFFSITFGLDFFFFLVFFVFLYFHPWHTCSIFSLFFLFFLFPFPLCSPFLPTFKGEHTLFPPQQLVPVAQSRAPAPPCTSQQDSGPSLGAGLSWAAAFGRWGESAQWLKWG